MSEASNHPNSLGQPGAVAAIGVGAAAMIGVGVQPLLLDALVQAGRLSQALVHPAVLLDLFGMGLAIALAACFLPPRRLRRTAALAALAGLLLELAVIPAHGGQILILRGLSGLANGLLIWITIGFLARRTRPEPWAAAFAVSQSLGQLVLAGLTGGLLLPRLGLAAGLAGPAAMSAIALLLSTSLPRAFTPLPRPMPAGLPAPRGLIGLVALFAYVAAGTGVWLHMTRLAGAPGLAGVTVSATLCAQVLGVLFAVLSAGRLKPGQVFAAAALATLAAYAILALQPPPALFIAAFALASFSGMALGTWLFSFLIQADPSRRAAAASAAVQLTGSAVGPLIAGAVVNGGDPRLALAVGAVLVGVTLAISLGLTRPLGNLRLAPQGQGGI
jgi:DHA1 family inner membrane transport protein